MSYADQAARTATAHPIQLIVNRASGPVTGLTVKVAIRLASTVASPSYLDFSDNTFKTTGHTTRQQPLAEVDATLSPGIYALDGGLDINGMTGLPVAEEHLVAEYEVTGVGISGAALDIIALNPPVDIVAIDGSTESAQDLSASARTIVRGTVDTTATPSSTTEFESDDITEATDNHFNGRIIIFTSGALKDQATDIIDYTNVAGRGKFTVTALTEPPADDDTFVIV